MTTKKPGVFPFPYYGEGSATPVREKDGLNALLVFAAPLSSEAKKSIAASAPSPMRVTTGSTAQWLFLNAPGRVASKALTAWVNDRCHSEDARRPQRLRRARSLLRVRKGAREGSCQGTRCGRRKSAGKSTEAGAGRKTNQGRHPPSPRAPERGATERSLPRLSRSANRGDRDQRLGAARPGGCALPHHARSAFWAVALHFLAKSESYGSEVDLRKCPKHISIVGELSVDPSSASAITNDVLGWLKKPGPAYLPFPEPPFAIAKAKGAGTALVVKPARMTKQVVEFVKSAEYKLGEMFEACPAAKRAGLEHPVAGKTQIRLSWAGAAPPAAVSRGPLLNVARRLHVKVGALTVVELG